MITTNTSRADAGVKGFPADSQDAQLTVFISVNYPAILSVDVAANSFQVTFSTDMHWEGAACLGGMAQYGCVDRVGTWYFLWAPQMAPGIDGINVLANLRQSSNDKAGAFVGAQGSGGGYNGECIDGDYLAVTSKFQHTYSMSYCVP